MTENFKSLTEMDRVIHEPARLMIVAILYTLEGADFLYLLRESGFTKGNLSTHLTRLEQSEYIQVQKSFRGKISHTTYQLTPKGKNAFEVYRGQLKSVLENTAQVKK
jgi:DNA-binding MarR family transcriptional regulator